MKRLILMWCIITVSCASIAQWGGVTAKSRPKPEDGDIAVFTGKGFEIQSSETLLSEIGEGSVPDSYPAVSNAAMGAVQTMNGNMVITASDDYFGVQSTVYTNALGQPNRPFYTTMDDSYTGSNWITRVFDRFAVMGGPNNLSTVFSIDPISAGAVPGMPIMSTSYPVSFGNPDTLETFQAGATTDWVDDNYPTYAEATNIAQNVGGGGTNTYLTWFEEQPDGALSPSATPVVPGSIDQEFLLENMIDADGNTNTIDAFVKANGAQYTGVTIVRDGTGIFYGTNLVSALADLEDGDTVALGEGVYTAGYVLLTNDNVTIRGVGPGTEDGNRPPETGGSIIDGSWIMHANNYTIEDVGFVNTVWSNYAGWVLSGDTYVRSGLTNDNTVVHMYSPVKTNHVWRNVNFYGYDYPRQSHLIEYSGDTCLMENIGCYESDTFLFVLKRISNVTAHGLHLMSNGGQENNPQGMLIKSDAGHYSEKIHISDVTMDNSHQPIYFHAASAGTLKDININNVVVDGTNSVTVYYSAYDSGCTFENISIDGLVLKMAPTYFVTQYEGGGAGTANFNNLTINATLPDIAAAGVYHPIYTGSEFAQLDLTFPESGKRSLYLDPDSNTPTLVVSDTEFEYKGVTVGGSGLADGDTLTTGLYGPEPSATNQYATKSYVDDNAGGSGGVDLMTTIRTQIAFDGSSFYTNTTGTAGVFPVSSGVALTADATNSTAMFILQPFGVGNTFSQLSNYGGTSANYYRNNWTLPRRLYFNVNRNWVGNVDHVATVHFGGRTSTTAFSHDLSAHGIGVRFNWAGSKIDLLVHDGTTQHEIDATNVTDLYGTGIPCLFCLESDNGTVNLYLNGTLIATTTNGPVSTDTNQARLTLALSTDTTATAEDWFFKDFILEQDAE